MQIGNFYRSTPFRKMAFMAQDLHIDFNDTLSSIFNAPNSFWSFYAGRTTRSFSSRSFVKEGRFPLRTCVVALSQGVGKLHVLSLPWRLPPPFLFFPRQVVVSLTSAWAAVKVLAFHVKD